MSVFSCILIGDETLSVACGDLLIDRGADLRAVATRDVVVRDWAVSRGLPVMEDFSVLASMLAPGAVDWVLSVANLRVLPAATLALGARGAVNFHDGPLPERAGLNAPVWALIEGAAEHGITWHMIDGGIDEGDILVQRRFAVTEDDTVHALNARCYAAAMDSFPEVLDQLEAPVPARHPQDLTRRRYFAMTDRPQADALLDFRKPVAELANLVRALDFAGYANPVALPKLALARGLCVVSRAAAAEGQGAPGQVLEVEGDALVVACAEGAVRLSGLRGIDGRALEGAARAGDVLAMPDGADALTARMAGLARHEDHWRRALTAQPPLRLPLAVQGAASGIVTRKVPVGMAVPLERRLAVLGLWALASSGQGQAMLAFRGADLAALCADGRGHVAPWVPLTLDRTAATLAEVEAAIAVQIEAAARHKGFAADLPLRDPGLGLLRPDIGIALDGAPIDGCAVTAWPGAGAEIVLHFDGARLDPAMTDLLAERLAGLLAMDTADAAGLLCPTSAESARIDAWNRTDAPWAADLTVHRAFEVQVARDPERTALVFEDRDFSYGALDARANAVAAALQAAGVGPGRNVALCLRRGPDLLIGALGILKAGGAYVPLDPDYPAGRIAHVIADSAAPVILTQDALRSGLPHGEAQVISIDDIPGSRSDNVDGGAGPDDLAYLIYTSGSTGVPKGVMVAHRNVSNFFAGMDAHVTRQDGDVWLAVTSLAFDISVLELFYSLARGFKVVISGDGNRAAVSSGAISGSDRGMDFGLFFWGNDDGPGPRKYELLLEGAKFADRNGFTSIWTPERHFHAFGGPYPNPAVTGAAIAAVTRNISVRAGSCVAPLHHPARIAEEWAVIDNLTSGRAGLGFAAGWQPVDFVLRPENAPPHNKASMYDTIDKVRALWRGEAVAFAHADGTTHEVITQPRPVSRELQAWVTTAGNPDTWREAGEKGLNVLTHLLGQTIPEVGQKIGIYHAALRGAGHDPADFTVTLMLHCFLAEDRETAREIARGPMKDYLRSAAGLIKHYAWTFPAFKRPKGVNNSFEMDLDILEEGELEAILDFAFERYFEDAGLFGSVEDGVARTEQLKRIGVDEIAGLVDYGIAPETVMEGLKPLAEVLRRSNAPVVLVDDDFSIAAQILRHGVTHLQCTPSMARLMAMNTEARAALGRVKHLMLGGEALPGDLLRDLSRATRAEILNLYGPTETTVWSSARKVGDPGEGTEPIGGPMANQSLHVLDDACMPLPIGVPGELWIGGAGVTPGYWQRPELTTERFAVTADGARLYRTGDLVAWRPDGTLAFFGRTDHQVKIRGQRIELGEIETCIKRFAGVTEAVVTARPTPGNDLRLTGYFTASATVPEPALRAHLKKHLPEAMVPAYLVVLERFPLTPNKKIDRNALPEPQAARTTLAANMPRAPASDAGRVVAGVWRDVLGVTNVSTGDNFFDLGGHSLLAVQAHRDIRARIEGVQLSITDIFRFPVLADLVAHIEGGGPAPAPAPAEPAVDRSATMSRRRAMRAGRGAR